jgi:OFA family oxalate/formate antiporter-like MFS transporter
LGNRWLQLALGIVTMVMISNLQYAWTLFVNPLSDAHGWSKAEVQVAFTLFALFQVWLVPVNGWFIDRIGPSRLVALGGVLAAASWLIFSAAQTLGTLYLGGAIGGISAGIVYGAGIASAVKWFPEKRGLAVGLTAAGFGGGAALTILPISHMLATRGYTATFATFAILIGCIIVLCALFLRFPREADTVPKAIPAFVSNVERTPAQMLRQPIFYLLYVMFVMIACGLLVMTAQIAPFAKDFGFEKVPVFVLGLAFATLQFALIADNVLNGLSRAAFGALSDRIGRESTMLLAFLLEAGALLGFLLLAPRSPWLFVVFAGLTFIASGEIYSLFPSACTDLFGRRHAATNCGLLYTAKGTAALVVPFASLVRQSTGSWTPVLATLVVFNVISALLAVFALRPMRMRAISRDRLVAERPPQAVAS